MFGHERPDETTLRIDLRPWRRISYNTRRTKAEPTPLPVILAGTSGTFDATGEELPS